MRAAHVPGSRLPHIHQLKERFCDPPAESGSPSPPKLLQFYYSGRFSTGDQIRARRRTNPQVLQNKQEIVVPGGGVEPPRAEARRILSPLRLPVPPSRHGISRAEKFSLIDRVGLCNRAGPTLRLWPLSGSEGLSVATRRNRRSRCLRCGSRLVAEGCRRSCCDIRFCNERRWAGRDRSRGEKL